MDEGEMWRELERSELTDFLRFMFAEEPIVEETEPVEPVAAPENATPLRHP